MGGAFLKLHDHIKSLIPKILKSIENYGCTVKFPKTLNFRPFLDSFYPHPCRVAHYWMFQKKFFSKSTCFQISWNIYISKCHFLFDLKSQNYDFSNLFFYQFLVIFRLFNFGELNFFIYRYIFWNFMIFWKVWYHNFENPLKIKVTRSIFVKLCVWNGVGS